MEDFVSFFKENPVCFLATVEKGKPCVRPVQLMFADSGKLYFCTANTKDMYKQMRASPSVQLATTSKDYVTTLRVTGGVRFCDDMAVKERIIKGSDLVRSIYKAADNPVFEAFYIEHGTAKFQYLNGQPPKVVEF